MGVRFAESLKPLNLISLVFIVAVSVILGACSPPPGGTAPLLSAPQNVVVTTLSSSSIHIDWYGVQGAQGYYVYRCGIRDGSYFRVSDTLLISSEFTDDRLSADCEYWYTVVAFAHGHEHENSAPCSGTTNLSVPTGVTVTAPDPGELALSWNDVDSADGYNIYRSDAYSGPFVSINPVPLASSDFSESGLEDQTSYWYEIAALRGGVEQDRSSPVNGVTMIGPLDIVSVFYLTSSSLRITWTSYGGSLDYLVFRSTDSGGQYTQITPSPISGTSFDDSGLAGDTEYWYRLDAVRDGVTQSPGDPRSGLTSPYWARTYEPIGGAEATVLLPAADGGLILGGTADVPYLADASWVVKVDDAGLIQWEKRYSVHDLRSLRPTSDGGIVMASVYWDASIYDHDAAVTKLDDQGNVSWSRRFGDAYNRSDNVSFAAETVDGGYVVVGHMSRTYGAWILRLDGDGDILWCKAIGNSNSARFYTVSETSDGGFLGVGSCYTTVDGYDGWLAKFDSDGVLEWQTALGSSGSAYDFLRSMDECSDGDYILTGSLAGTLWVLRIDPDGTIEWQKTYGQSDGSEYRHVATTGDGGFLVSSYSSTLGPSFYDIWLLKLQSDGDIDWQVCYGMSGKDMPAQVAESAGGEMVVLGERYDEFLVLSLPDDGILEGSGLYVITSETAADASSVERTPDLEAIDLSLSTSTLNTSSVSTNAVTDLLYP
jgi:hypothetical protein